MDDYPISTVHALAKAASINKAYDTLSMSSAVAAGAVHAVEAGFGGKSPKALKRYQDGLLRQVRRQQSKGKGVSKDAQTLFSGFAGVAPQEKGNGRRQNKSGGDT